MATTTDPWQAVCDDLHGIQQAFARSGARYRTLVAGRRFGKNHAAIVSDADFALAPDTYPYGRDDPERVVLWWIGPTYNQTLKYGFQQARDALPDAAIADTKKTAPFEIHLTNGVTWEFYSFDRPQSLDGAGVDSMTIDERGYMDTDIWETNLAAMLLDTDGRVAFIGKPWHNDHFKECFQKGQSADHPAYDSWHATSYDNPRIPDERIDDIFGDLPEPVYRREILAEFDAGGKILTLDMLDSIPADEWRDASDRWHWHIGVDIGVTMDSSKARESDSDYWAVAVVAEHPLQPEAYVLDIARERGQTPTHAARWLAGLLEDIPTDKCYVEAVQAQRWFLEDCRDVGLQPVAVEHDRSKEERLMYLGVPFENDSVRLVDGVDWSDFKNEWAAFPDGSHDDQLDALEIALRHTNLKHQYHAESMDPYGQTDAES